MSTGGYHHAAILSPAFYARQCYSDNISNDSSYWKHEDAARHLSNHVMNKYPNLNVLCLNNSTYMKNDLWSDSTRINACLFSQASRIVLFIPDDAAEHITYFSRHCLHPLLCRSRDQGGRPEWHSRFIAVAIGSVQVPNQLNPDVPFINVIRFREIGWFRDIMGMMLLEKAIKDFWIPPEMKEATSQHSNLKQSIMISIKYSLNEIVETTSLVDITTHVIGKMDLDEIQKNSRSRLKSSNVKQSMNGISHDKNEINNSKSHNHSSRLEGHLLRSNRRLIKPEFEAEQLQENILEARLTGTIGQVVPVNIKNELVNLNSTVGMNEHDKHFSETNIHAKTSTESPKVNVNELSSSLDLNNTSLSISKSVNNIQSNENSIITTTTNLSDDNLPVLQYSKSLISSTVSNISSHHTPIVSDLKTPSIPIVETIDDKLKQCLNYEDIPMIDEDTETITTTTNSINRIIAKNPTVTIDTKVKRSKCSDGVNDLTQQKQNKTNNISSQSSTIPIQCEGNERQKIRCSSTSPSKKPIRIIPISRTKSVEPKLKESVDVNKPTDGYIKTINISTTKPKELNQTSTTPRSNSTSRITVRKCLRSAIASPSRSSRSNTKFSSPYNKKIEKIYASTPFSKLQNMLSDSSTQMISPLATGVFTNDGVTCYALTGLQYRQKTNDTTMNDKISSSNDDDDNNNNDHSNTSTTLSVSREMNNWTGPDSAETYRLELLLANNVLIEKNNEKLNPDEVDYITWQLLGVFAFTFVTLMISLTVAFTCLHREGCDFVSFIKYTIEFFKRS
ncbi:putative serine-rich repeat protein [Schistosoma mansoni]|uniref:putative serine-rich repeat protein n=1 Tax=Schistosoma mansoni TaxID=6183 RepID=UPI0001A61E25|nr:putative serine-rich repeat protein [Schistosoma mansoni]|eukprot:XP_018650352.1 putative serine-rich repeat protein [Schistosoma mansoni]